MPRRAYSYIRWSGWVQGKGDSRRRQLAEWAPRVARERGWLLDEGAVITDEARSAYDGSNKDLGALAAFLADVKSGHIPRGSVLLVESLDRLSREELDEANELVMGLFRTGISIMTREPERFYDSGSKRTLSELVEIFVILSRGHEESATKSMRLRSKWAEKRRLAREEKRPRGKRVPGWVVLKGGRYEVRPGCAETVRLIYQLAADGLGLPAIADELARRGSAFPCWFRKGKWQTSSLHRFIKGREALGEYQPRKKVGRRKYAPEGEPVPGYYPALIDEETWLAAQAALRSRNRRTGRPAAGLPNLFTGLVWHARVRERVHLQTDYSHGGKYRKGYLGTRQDVPGPDRSGPDVRWRYDSFEQATLEAIEELTVRDLLPPDVQADAQEKRSAELNRKLTALHERALMLKARVENPDATAQQAADAMDSLDRVRVQQAKVAAELERLKLETFAGRGDDLARLQTLAEHWREKRDTPEGKGLGERLKGMLQRVVSEIWVKPVRLSRQKMLLHVQLYLTSGGRRYFQVLPLVPPRGFRAPCLENCDFRAGKIGDGTADPKPDA
jgi:DNA invertase Pin-like site-specific DNA recombinase